MWQPNPTDTQGSEVTYTPQALAATQQLTFPAGVDNNQNIAPGAVGQNPVVLKDNGVALGQGIYRFIEEKNFFFWVFFWVSDNAV